ncbi:N-acetyltransferase [Nocardioides pocheonensis]|uniref:N-acetyltransferase n=1 Tax=Nocardioides pocheonensis TaxID=661485 RepID=A0A3N0GUE0_9ACTN|nr:N-acetyltransferase [Nocardioides pocheonensis]
MTRRPARGRPYDARVDAPRRNEFGQPIGPAVEWSPREPVSPVHLEGRWSRVEPVAAHHLDGLYDALVLRSPDSIWTYLAAGPFPDRAGLNAWLRSLHDEATWFPHAICQADGRPLGIASYLRADPANGSVEVGGIAYAAALQRTTAATEAMYLMARHVFDDLGYRRYEWKCDALNEPSRRAAARLGFTYEGTFRNALVYKGRNRDTAWFSITDAEWPAIRTALEEWLDPANHDEDGGQRAPLRAAR